jgi:hypothetical protein
MFTGRVNSDESIETARRMLDAAGGSWAAIERVAQRDERGVYVVRRGDLLRERDRAGD